MHMSWNKLKMVLSSLRTQMGKIPYTENYGSVICQLIGMVLAYWVYGYTYK